MYIYYLKIMIWDKNSDNVDFDNMITHIFYNIDQAIKSGVEFIQERIVILSDDDNVDVLKYILDNNLEYIFEIIKIHTIPFMFKTKYEKEKYYKESLRFIDKNNLYEFLMRLCNFEYMYFSYNGILRSSQLGLDEYNLTCSTKAFNEEQYHYEKFNKGDIVKIKDSDDTKYRIYSVSNADISIYESEDPLNLNKGYFIETLNGDPVNDYGANALSDEDLILVYE